LGEGHMTNMYVGRSPKFIWALCHVMCTAALIGPATSPIPPHWDSYTRGAIGQQRKTTSLCNPLGRGGGSLTIPKKWRVYTCTEKIVHIGYCIVMVTSVPIVILAASIHY
jgi:hypothetical protein